VSLKMSLMSMPLVDALEISQEIAFFLF